MNDDRQRTQAMAQVWIAIVIIVGLTWYGWGRF